MFASVGQSEKSEKSLSPYTFYACKSVNNLNEENVRKVITHWLPPKELKLINKCTDCSFDVTKIGFTQDKVFGIQIEWADQCQVECRRGFLLHISQVVSI